MGKGILFAFRKLVIGHSSLYSQNVSYPIHRRHELDRPSPQNVLKCLWISLHKPLIEN